MKKYFTRVLDPAKPHPYMLSSAEDLAERARLVFDERDELLVKAFEAVAADASPDPSQADEHRFDTAAKTLGAAYISALYRSAGRGEESARYAALAREALLEFARMGAPERRKGYGLLDHNYLIALAFAYDLVWDMPEWTPGERDSLRALFYGSMDDLRYYMHAKHLSNHAAWSQCRAATTAFLFKDEALAAECLDGPDSYPVRLAHEFFDDGMNYEQSTWGYQVYSVMPVTIVALAARGAGALPDPVTLSVDNELSLVFSGGTTGDYTMPFYPTDEEVFPRPEKKNLQLALTAQFDMLRPDTSCPSIGDYGQPTPAMADHFITELVWDLYGDERAARLLSMGQRRAEGARMIPPHLFTLAFGKPLPPSPRFESASTIYPQGGYAVMKSIEGDAFWGSPSIHAVLSFGPFGNGHGHADKLHLDIAGAGRKTCIEELHRDGVTWQYWNSTVSHNSVVVGQKSQRGNAEKFVTGIDSCGRLVFHHFGAQLKVACAEDGEVYQGVPVYRRTVAVADEYIVDVFEVKSDDETTFDYFLHGMGALEIDGVELAESSFSGAADGYEYLTNVRAGRPGVGGGEGGGGGGGLTARFSAGHSVFVPLRDGLEVISAEGPWKKDATRPVLVLRKHGREALFVVVHDPSGASVEAVELETGGEGRLVLSVKLAERVDGIELVRRGDAGGAWDVSIFTRR